MSVNATSDNGKESNDDSDKIEKSNNVKLIHLLAYGHNGSSTHQGASNINGAADNDKLPIV